LYIQLCLCWFVFGFVRKSLPMSLFVIVLAAFAVLFSPSASAVATEPGLTAPEAIKIETTKTETTKVDATKTEAAKNRKAEYAAEDKAKGIKRANAPCIAWSDPDVPTRAVLLCIHGLGLHKDTYEAFGKRMQALGIATYAIDVRGFGDFMASKGQKTCDFDGCLSDVRRSLIAIRRLIRINQYFFSASLWGAPLLCASLLCIQS
jgi:hypothetical protein